ncbi:MAG: dihydroorotate dehydrogenase [Planctomycetota bacterium]|nr:dihydroorotate dehydrogenase [Planctomycetota bacterium]
MPHTSSVPVDLAGISLASPVILAAGTAGTLDEMSDVLDLSRVGGIVTKSITRLPREGNATWRILESRAGMINAIGLANIGIDAFLRSEAPRIASVPTRVFLSIAGFSIEDYVEVARAGNTIDAAPAVELNVSCPNVHGGTEFGVDPGLLRDLVASVRAVLDRKRLFVKLSPVSIAAPGYTIVDLARAALESGADGLSLCNTTPAMEIDVHTRLPRLANVTGGLSGPAVHPIVTRLIHLVHRQMEAGSLRRAPIIGIGGVTGWRDAAAFILAGASAVQMGTALFADPRGPIKVARGLEAWTKRHGLPLKQLVGGVKLPEPASNANAAKPDGRSASALGPGSVTSSRQNGAGAVAPRAGTSSDAGTSSAANATPGRGTGAGPGAGAGAGATRTLN